MSLPSTGFDVPPEGSSLSPKGVVATPTTARSAAATASVRGTAVPAFDVCHAGVVLRAVLGVLVAVAVGVAFAAGGWADALLRIALAAAVAFPAVLLWLATMCMAKRPLARLGPAAQTTVAIALGAVCGAGCWAVQGAWGIGVLAVDGRGFAPGRWGPAALAGAAGAALLAGWLRLRTTAQGPADAGARLAELQSRIRPHFLFNTLNSAIALARVDPARTEGLLEDLAELFRAALAAGGDAVATLDDEVDLARRYLAIEQTRFGARLRVAWELDPAAGAARVPALLLQPLVENAVRHGVEPSADGGAVRIRTRMRHGHAVVTIDNTLPDASGGNGKNAAPRPGAGIALANVRERLRLMHDVAAQFDARREGGVWRVRVVVPLA